MRLLSAFCLGIISLQLITCASNTVNSIETIISDMDMTQRNEGIPKDVPDYIGWKYHPQITMGSSPFGSAIPSWWTGPEEYKDADPWNAITGWGVLFEAEEDNPASNTRVEFRNIQVYYLSKADQNWHLIVSSRKVAGFLVDSITVGDFKVANVRTEPGGTISAKLDKTGTAYHFWHVDNSSPNIARTPINPFDIDGVFVTFQARLIVDNLNFDDDRDSAKYLVQPGADYWPEVIFDDATEFASVGYNPGVGIGRIKYVTKEWHAFNMHTVSAQQINNNPPPFE